MSVSDLYVQVRDHIQAVFPAGGRFDTEFEHAIGTKDILGRFQHPPSACWVLGETPDDFVKNEMAQSNSRLRIHHKRLAVFDIYLWAPSILDIEQEEIQAGDTDSFGNALTPRPPGILHYYVAALHRFGGNAANLKILEGQWSSLDQSVFGAAYRIRVEQGFIVHEPRYVIAPVTTVTKGLEFDNG